MTQNSWSRRCAALSRELHAACAEALKPSEVRLEDRTVTMLAEESDPQVIPYYPIGSFYRYRLRERGIRHLFGRRWLPIRYRRLLVSFAMEEMWHAPHWAERQGLHCTVYDDRLVMIVRPIVERFALTNALKLDFAPRAA